MFDDMNEDNKFIEQDISVSVFVDGIEHVIGKLETVVGKLFFVEN